MSNVHNHNAGLTINIYNPPSAPETNQGKMRGLSSQEQDFESSDGKRHGDEASGIDKLPLPTWLKAGLKSVLGDTGDGLPPAADAAKTLRDFQTDKDIGLLVREQVKHMAETGYCTMPNGKQELVPEHVQLAAQKMMANGGELFGKMETSIVPDHDGLLSAADYGAALKNGTIGKPGTADLPTEKVLNIDAFLKATMGGAISSNSPGEYNAAKTIQGFQKENDIKHLTSNQVAQMADTGCCTRRGGDTFQVPPDVQSAAKKMMENNAELFKKLETPIVAKHDGLLSVPDVDQAIKNGSLARPNSPTTDKFESFLNGIDKANAEDGDFADMIQQFLKQFINEMANRPESSANTGKVATGPAPATPNNNGPVDKSEFGAIDTMKTFMGANLGKEMLNRDQMQQMADTGKLTKQNGVIMDVPKDVQESAKRLMANNGAMFDKIEEHKGKKDGIISQADFKPAWKDSVKETTSTIIDFQKSELKGDFLTQAHMKEMADTGKLTKNDGSAVQVPPKVREAAKNYMDNDAKLFKEVESWQDNMHDNKLSVKDGETRRHRLDHGKIDLLAALPSVARIAAPAA